MKLACWHRVFIGSKEYGKFRNIITLEANVLDDSKKTVLSSSIEFDNRKSNKILNLAILKNEIIIQDIVVQMIMDNVEKDIFIGSATDTFIII